jgi:hypothetical protein
MNSVRLRYSDMLDARMQAQIGVLMRLSIEAIDGIRQEFMQAPGHALDVMGFVDTVGRCGWSLFAFVSGLIGLHSNSRIFVRKHSVYRIFHQRQAH